MNRLGWLKRQYRQRPLPAIATTMAGVDLTLGLVEGSFSLALFGITLGLGGGMLAWRLTSPSLPQSPPIFLPYASSNAPVIQLEPARLPEDSDPADS